MAVDGAFVEVNTALCRILGRTADDLRGLTFQAVTHPDDLQADLALVEELLADRRRSYELEKRYLRADGTAVPCELHVALVRDPAGEPLHFVAQMVD
ncbi:MAG: PAS domain S-box protein, partial [Egicoccus sp.]